MEMSGHLHTLGTLPMQKALLVPIESVIRGANHGAIDNLRFILNPVL